MSTSTGATRKRSKPEKSIREILTEGLPPQNIEAERMLLGCVLRDNSIIHDLVRVLSPDDFYSDKHQKIFKAMLSMSSNGIVIDAVTLGEQLAADGVLLEVGGAPTIVELFQQTLTAVNSKRYAELIHDKSVIRSLIRVGHDILRDAYESAGEPKTLLEDAQRRVMDIASTQSASDTIHIDEVLQLALSRMSERQNRDGSWTGGVPSGFLDLDQLTNGFQDNELLILAARPSMGKTSLAMNFVEHAAVDHKMPVLFVSLEMSQLELAERLLCSRANVNLQFLRKGRLSSEDTANIIRAGDELGSASLYIDDTPGQTMMRIAANARRLEAQHGKPGQKWLRLIVIDYLQLIEADDRSVSRQEQISTISRRLKILAKDLHVPVIALSQLNRSAEQREGHRPRMSDLRESGSIEQDADVVMLLHRDDAYDPTSNPNEADLIIAKQRNGPVGDIKLSFVKELTRFRDFYPNIQNYDNSTQGEF